MTLFCGQEACYEAVEGFAVNVEVSGDFAQGDAVAEHRCNLIFLMVKFELFGNIDRAFRTSEPDSFRSFAGESLLGPLAYQVALDFSGKSESESQNLAGNVIPESVIVLDCPHSASFCHTDVKDFHNHKETPAEPGKFRTDDEVAASGAFEKIAEPPFAVGFGAADGFLNPAVNDNAVAPAELENLKPLILNSLLIAAYTNIPIIHNSTSSVSRTFCPATASAELLQN